MRRAILCGMLLSLLAMPAWATPQRVVSLNLCTDQLAISMLPEKRLKGVSFNADDAALSLVARAAARYPAFKGSIEEMANSQPDMVLMGTGQNTRLQQWLEEKSIPSIASAYRIPSPRCRRIRWPWRRCWGCRNLPVPSTHGRTPRSSARACRKRG